MTFLENNTYRNPGDLSDEERAAYDLIEAAAKKYEALGNADVVYHLKVVAKYALIEEPPGSSFKTCH